MVEDASLDDFLGSGDDDADEERGTGSTDSTGGDGAGTAAEDAAAPEDGRDVAPATTTYVWSDEGTTCEECGAPAERRWQQDGALVCPDCKVW